MSIKVMTLVWQFAPYRGNTLLTLLALADWSNDEGLSWPKLETLAAKSRQSVRSAQYAVDELCRGEMLSTLANPGRGNANQYLINMQKLHLLQSAERVQFATEKGAKHDTKGCKTRQRNKEEPSGYVKNHQNDSNCPKCQNSGTWEHKGHPGALLYCSCPAGTALMKDEKSAQGASA